MICKECDDKDCKEWTDWFLKNLIYCEDTHSFVHRLYDEIKTQKVNNHKDAQHIAFTILGSMYKEFKKIKMEGEAD